MSDFQKAINEAVERQAELRGEYTPKPDTKLLSAEELDTWRKLAKKATYLPVGSYGTEERDEFEKAWDNWNIAASPTNVIAMIDHITALEAENERLHANLTVCGSDVTLLQAELARIKGRLTLPELSHIFLTQEKRSDIEIARAIIAHITEPK